MAYPASPITIEDNDSVISMEEEEEKDAFLEFVDYARSVLSPESDENGEDCSMPGWSWIVSRILKTCIAYSSGVTAAILLSDLSQAWNEHHRVGAPKRRPECITQLKNKHRRTRLPNTVTIDSIYEKNFLSTNCVLEAIVVDAFLLPGTNIYMLSLGDFWSSSTIDLYLHRGKGDPSDRMLPSSAPNGSGYPRILPTEYLVILLDEDQDDDAMLLGAQFCSDSFSSISLDAVKNGASYSFYARIESIGLLEVQGRSGSLQQKQINLVDNDGIKLKFLLWGDQVLLANLFSVGCMLALDRPFIANALDSGIEACEGISLEYGSATQLYLVPFVQHEQVCLSSTQNHHQGLGQLGALGQSQVPKVSQVMLPCNPLGSIDFSNYPFRLSVTDIHEKMTSFSLYGVVTNIFRERSSTETIFYLRIEDATGAVMAKLHFAKSWSLGRLGLGHTVYISGLTCSMTNKRLLEVSWFEKDDAAFFVNLSCLPALLNSPCLHKLSYLSDLSVQTSITLICQVRLDQIEHFHVNTRFSHTHCGHFVNERPDGLAECTFCHCTCDGKVVRTFHLKITVADETKKVFAWCTGQTATELLQISPSDFYELPEEEQAIYPSSLENERFIVALVNCKREGHGLCDGLNQHDVIAWEITRALKFE